MSSPLPRQMKESDWRVLVNAIRNNNLIPLVGTDLIQVEVGGYNVTYDHFIAQELARKHQIGDADLAVLGTSLTQTTLNEVVSVCINKEGDRYRFDLHDDIFQIIQDS